MDVSMYDALTDNIDVDDIAKNSNNRIVLRRLQRNNANDTNNELYITKIRRKIVMIIIQRGRMIWDGWVTSLEKINTWRSCVCQRLCRPQEQVLGMLLFHFSEG